MAFETYKLFQYSDIDSDEQASELAYTHGHDWIMNTFNNPEISNEKKQRLREVLKEHQPVRTSLLYEQQAKRLTADYGVEISSSMLQSLVLNDYHNAVKEYEKSKYTGFLVGAAANFANSLAQGIVYDGIHHPLKLAAQLIAFKGLGSLVSKSALGLGLLKNSPTTLKVLSGAIGDNIYIGIDNAMYGDERNSHLRDLHFQEVDGGVSLTSVSASLIFHGIGNVGALTKEVSNASASTLSGADLFVTKMFKSHVIDSKVVDFMKRKYKGEKVKEPSKPKDEKGVFSFIKRTYTKTKDKIFSKENKKEGVEETTFSKVKEHVYNNKYLYGSFGGITTALFLFNGNTKQKANATNNKHKRHKKDELPKYLENYFLGAIINGE